MPVLQLSASGQRGLPRSANECYALGRYLAERIAEFGHFKIIYDGRGGIPGLCWELKDPASSSFTLYEYADRLRERGWLVPAYSMPPNREDLVIQRILFVTASREKWPINFCSKCKARLTTWPNIRPSSRPASRLPARRRARTTIPADKSARRRK